MIKHNYAQSHTTPDSPTATRLIEATDATYTKPEMLSGPLVMRTVQILLKSMQAKRVLDVGTFSGYSALSIAEALPIDGQVVSLDLFPNNIDFANQYLENSPHRPKMKFIVGDAMATLQTLEGPFDAAFIDADKARYQQYLEVVYPLIRPGGLMVFDNTWFGGSVAAPRKHSQVAMRDFNAHLVNDERLITVMLPIRDGLTLCYKKEE